MYLIRRNTLFTKQCSVVILVSLWPTSGHPGPLKGPTCQVHPCQLFSDLLFKNKWDPCKSSFMSSIASIQNRHWLLLPWLIDTVMEMVGRKPFLWEKLKKVKLFFSGCGFPPGDHSGSQRAVDNVSFVLLRKHIGSDLWIPMSVAESLLETLLMCKTLKK